ncbi:MAG TPA: PAAR domain-containing protein [Mycobacterium sp.]|jgi:uncharacterized Zn-binding protein involved in type VI secretion
MPPAARLIDPTAHGGVVTGPGVPTVLIMGMPAAAAGDMHTCAVAVHPPSPFPMGSMTVLIGGRPALRLGDVCGCGAPIVWGAPTVLIG